MMEKVQKMDLEDVKHEMDLTGIKYPAGASDIEMRLMLVESRCRVEKSRKRKPPGPNAGKSERLRFEKPWIDKYLNELLDNYDINRYNAFVEYIEDRDMAIARYGDVDIYQAEFKKCDDMVAQVVESSPKLEFDGFPAPMGEAMIKQSLSEFGAIKNFSAITSDDGTTLSGRVEYDDNEQAEAAVAKWDGVDMGGGAKLSLKYLEE